MQSKLKKITLIYVIISLFMAIICHKFLTHNILNPEFYSYVFIKDILFIFFTGLIFNYILVKNEKRNIRVLKRMQIANRGIRESNEKYDIVSKATRDTIWDWNIQEDKMIWSQGIETIFGYKQEAVVNNSSWWFDKIHPEDSIKVSVKLYSFIEGKTEHWQDQYRFRCADGTYKYVLDRGFLLKDGFGKAIRMIGSIQDITKQKEEEQRLRLLEAVITQSKDSVLISEANLFDGINRKIVYINPAFSEMSGYSFAEVEGKSPDIFKGPNSDPSESNKLSKALKEGKECLVELINYKKDGGEYWVRISIIPILNVEKEITHWISIQRDITEEKKLEEEREHLIRELTQNNKDLKQFSYITSHNLRAPLSNLIGLLNLIEDIPINNPELEEILQGFNKSTHLLNETINDLVKVIFIKDNPSIEKEIVSLHEIFENVFSQLSFQIEKHKPIIKLDLEKVSLLNTNKAYIESIFLNLMTNSLKYKSENRKLRISISANQLGQDVVLNFSDNGIGIDLKRNRDKVFGLYQRFHDYPDSKGLGLYLVKSQVESMGGTISIESEVDKGTSFVITFKNIF